jgi:cell division septal protein FtsQ
LGSGNISGGKLFKSNRKKLNLRQPKVFRAGEDHTKEPLPKFVKVLIFLLIILAILFYMFFLSPWMKIKNIEIIGSPSDKVMEQINELKGHNIFLFSSSKEERKLINEDKDYSNIKIYRGIPDIIKIVFYDRNPQIILETQGIKYLVDENGIIYKEDSGNYSGLPTVVDTNNLSIRLSSQIFTSSFLNFVKSANNGLAQAKIKVVDFEIAETTFQVSAITDNNIKIMFNTLIPLSSQMDAFNQVYGQNKNDIKQYIDLRVEGRVYYQ